MGDEAIAGALASITTSLIRRLKPHWSGERALALFVALAIVMGGLAWASDIWHLAGLAWSAVQRILGIVLAGLGVFEAKRKETGRSHDTEPRSRRRA